MARPKAPVQLALPVKLPDHARYESYCVGGNGHALHHLQGLARGESPPGGLWLWGPPATGKTHLLQATAAAADALGRRVSYLPLGALPASAEAMLAGLETWDLVCVDDLHHVAGDASWELAVFSLWNGLQEQGGSLVLSSREPPASLALALADLRSRLRAASVYRLQPLSEAQLLEALQLRARRRGLAMPTDSARWLLRHVPRDAATLFSLLDRLDAEALAAQRPLSLAFVRDAVRGLGAAAAEEGEPGAGP